MSTFLHAAACAGCAESVEALLAAGADVNAVVQVPPRLERDPWWRWRRGDDGWLSFWNRQERIPRRNFTVRDRGLPSARAARAGRLGRACCQKIREGSQVRRLCRSSQSPPPTPTDSTQGCSALTLAVVCGAPPRVLALLIDGGADVNNAVRRRRPAPPLHRTAARASHRLPSRRHARQSVPLCRLLWDGPSPLSTP